MIMCIAGLSRDPECDRLLDDLQVDRGEEQRLDAECCFPPRRVVLAAILLHGRISVFILCFKKCEAKNYLSVNLMIASSSHSKPVNIILQHDNPRKRPREPPVAEIMATVSNKRYSSSIVTYGWLNCAKSDVLFKVGSSITDHAFKQVSIKFKQASSKFQVRSSRNLPYYTLFWTPFSVNFHPQNL